MNREIPKFHATGLCCFLPTQYKTLLPKLLQLCTSVGYLKIQSICDLRSCHTWASKQVFKCSCISLARLDSNHPPFVSIPNR